MNKHPREIYRKLSLEAYKNAKRFIDEAELLYKRKSLGHSYALAVLGFEEWVKSIIGMFLLSGFFKEDDEDVIDCFKNHVFKHHFGLIFIYYLILPEWYEKTKFKSEIDQLIIQFRKREINERRFEIEVEKYIKIDNSMEASNLKEFKKTLNKFLADINIIENQKQIGLYVGLDFKNNKISTPNDLKKLNMEATLETYRIFIESTAQRMEELKHQSAHDKKIKELYKDSKLLRDLIDRLNDKLKELEN